MKSSNSFCTSTSVNQESATTYYRPRFDLEHLAEETRVRVQVPGVAKEGLNLTVENNELLMEATGSSRLPESWKSLHRESTDRTYRLRLRLGDHVNHTAIAADLVDGILTLIVPKEETAKPRSIKVK